MNYVYNQWDYGYRDQPIPTRADFGGSGNRFGIGAMDQGSYTYNDTNSGTKELQELEIQAAHDQIRTLQYQIDQLQASSSQNATTQAQLTALYSELAKAKQVAGSGLTETLQKYLPYIAGGIGLLLLVAVAAGGRRTA